MEHSFPLILFLIGATVLSMVRTKWYKLVNRYFGLDKFGKNHKTEEECIYSTFSKQ